MDSKTKSKTMIANFLIGVMILTLLPGNVWAEARGIHDEKIGEYMQATSSVAVKKGDISTSSEAELKCVCDDICFEDEENTKCPVCLEDYADCQWAGDTLLLTTLSLATPSVTYPVPYEEISLDGRKFSMSTSINEKPYYQVLKFTTPEDGGGSYTLYSEFLDNRYSHTAGYLCTREQYEALCQKIEYNKCAPYGLSAPEDFLAYNDGWGGSLNFLINYELEDGEEYYLIATRDYSYFYNNPEYKLYFVRDLALNLDNSNADFPGITTLYSKGTYWYCDRNREDNIWWIDCPEKDGYMFAGYFSEKDGQGIKVIDQWGYLLDEIDELEFCDTIYALWEELPRFKSSRFKSAVKGEFYQDNLETTSSAPLYWAIAYGELPAGLSLNENTGVISGIPTQCGKKSFILIAINFDAGYYCYTMTSITVSAWQDSSDNEENISEWWPNAEGNWRYYTSGNQYYSNEWKLVKFEDKSCWYHFGKDGYIDTGWLADRDDRWYYLNPISDGAKGVMQTGWHTDPQDGNRYYLDPQTGQMTIGWVCIDGVWYYFTESGEEYSGWKWDEVAGSWIYENIGRRPMGALEPDKKRDE